MLKNYSCYCLLFAVITGLYACSADEDNSRQNEQNQTWFAKVEAEKEGGEVQTRSMFFGGIGGTRYYMLWDEGDNAEVYYDGTKVGNFTPNSFGYSNSYLTGTLTGTFSVGNTINLYVPKADLDFTGQKGTVGDMATNHTFMDATTTVSAVDASGNFLNMNNASFKHRQFFLSFQFMDQDGVRLHIEQLTIHTTSGMLVQTKPLVGEATHGDIVVNTEKVNGEYPSEVFVALHNDSGASDTYSFTVKSGGYIFASTDAASMVTANIADGKYYWVYRTLTLQGSATRLDSQVGSAIESHADGGGDSNGSVNF